MALTSALFPILLLVFPLPLLALCGVIAQRKQLAEERRRFATLKRISRGSRF